jgi:hypothetical protein
LESSEVYSSVAAMPIEAQLLRLILTLQGTERFSSIHSPEGSVLRVAHQ